MYFSIAAALLFLMNIGLYYFLDNVVFGILNWYNSQSLFLKIILLFGAGSLFTVFLSITQRLSTLLGGLIFNKLPFNWFTMVSTFIIAIGNAIWNIYKLWQIPTHYDFWIVIELLTLSGFIWSLIAIVLPAREQIKEYNRESHYYEN